MFKTIKIVLNSQLFKVNQIQKRCFLSQSYYCNEVWENRLNSPILQKVDLDKLYYDLEQRFQKVRQISAVDVDIFANALNNDLFLDELTDLLHKLRLSAETGNTLKSTGHATIRAMLKYKKTDELINIIDDRLNYGLFLDGYTANLLMDYFWKQKDFVSGARIASQLMLQEDFEHPVARLLSILHCYNYLLKPKSWPELAKPEEPEEEVKVRVKYLRNPFDDNHFDLKDPTKIVGKTLFTATKDSKDPLNVSFSILGLLLFGNEERAKTIIDDCTNNQIIVYKDIIDLIPEEKKSLTENLKIESKDIQLELENLIKTEINRTSEQDIANQCRIFDEWQTERTTALEEQMKRLINARRLADIENIKTSLQEKETELWFFENEENIELAIESQSQKTSQKLKTKETTTADENYIPPEVNKSIN